METLPANVTAEAEVYGRTSLPLVNPRPSRDIGSFKIGLPAIFAAEEAGPAARDQKELEEACRLEEHIKGPQGGATQAVTMPSPGPPAAGGPESPQLNPVVAGLRPGLKDKGRRGHATLSFRQRLAEEAFQMGAGGTTGKSFLQTLVEKLAAAGLKPPTVTVEYTKVNVEADALVGSANIPSLSNVAAATLKVGILDLICISSCHFSISTEGRKLRLLCWNQCYNHSACFLVLETVLMSDR